MALMNRLSRLITADFNAVLDRIEEPEALLKQAIRDMRDALQAGEQRLAETRRERAMLDHRQGELKQQLAQVEQQLDVCFDASQEQLAKSQIRRQLEAQRHLRLTTSRCEQVEQAIDRIGAELEANRQKLDSMQQKAALFAERSVADEVGPARPDFATVTDDEVEVAYLRELKRRTKS